MILMIYGASGAGIEVYDMAKRVNAVNMKYSRILLIDDYKDEEEYYGTQRIHFESCEKVAQGEAFEFIIAVGEPSARRLLADRISDKGYTLTTLVDNTAIVCDTAVLSPGCIVCAGSIVSSNARIDENCFIQYHVIVGHDAHVKKDTVICPKSTVGGNSTVGEQTFLGLNTSMKQGVNIGNRAIVGMGSMAFKDVDDDVTVVGNPARVTKGNENHKVFI
jgi:sugar O-acyltransferase (sialic acid O-acetyltransferase NeuD family)